MGDPCSPARTTSTLPPIAIVVEPRATLADTVADALRSRGFEVLVAATHVGGAQSALDHAQVDVLIAAVPAPGEDRTGAYLAHARALNPSLRTIVMLSDPAEDAPEAPQDAQRLIKPFTVIELEEALDQALVPHLPAEAHHAP